MINETFHLRRSELWIRELEGKHTCLAPTSDWFCSHLAERAMSGDLGGGGRGPGSCQWSHLYAWLAGGAGYLEAVLWRGLNDPNHPGCCSIFLSRPRSLMGTQKSIPRWGIADPLFGWWIFHLLQFGGSLFLGHCSTCANELFSVSLLVCSVRKLLAVGGDGGCCGWTTVAQK